MGTVNFYLKKAELSGQALIYLQFKYNGKKMVYSFGQNINPKNWTKGKQRVKSNTHTTADGKSSLNDLLDKLKLVCEKAYNTELKTGVPEPGTIKKHLIAYMNQNESDSDSPSLSKLIERFIKNEIKNKGKDKSPNTIKTYKTVQGHLNEFQQRNRYILNFEDITLDFYYKYVSFLKDKGLKSNAIAKDIQILKVFMSEAVDLGYTSNFQFKNKKFAVTREETDAVYLLESEIIKLYEYDLTENKRLEQVRDLFIFGCFIGLRFSDYSNVKPENIVTDKEDLFIKMITKKTKEHVIIPTNPIILEIFEKYKNNPNKLPKAISDQRFNDYIKEACKVAGLRETGRLITEPNKELWECITSHTARRSFATNYYLQNFPTIDLMKITGHRTERAFMRYIKITKLDAANRLNKHIKKNWPEKIYRLAS